MVRTVGFLVSFFAPTLLVSGDKLAITSDESARLLFGLPSDIRNCIVFASDKRPWEQVAFEAKLRSVCKTFNEAIAKIEEDSAFKRFSIAPMSFFILTGNFDKVARLNVEQGCSLTFEAGQKYRPIDYAIGLNSKRLLSALGFNVHYQKSESPDCNVNSLDHFWTICAQLSYNDGFKYYLYLLATSQSLRDALLDELCNLKKKYVSKFGCNENLRFFTFFLKVLIENLTFSMTVGPNYIGIYSVVWNFLLDTFDIGINSIVNEQGLTLLVSAINSGNKGSIELLLLHKVPVNQLTAHGMPPLYYAIKHKNGYAVLQLRQRSDIDLSWVDPETEKTLAMLLSDYDSTQ